MRCRDVELRSARQEVQGSQQNERTGRESNYDGASLFSVCMCVSVYVLWSFDFFSTTANPIHFTLAGFIVEGPRRCSVECVAVRVSGC